MRREALLLGLLSCSGIALLESLNASAGVYKLLLAGIEGVALGA